MRFPSMLIAGSLIAFSTVLFWAGTAEVPLFAQAGPAGIDSSHNDCGGEPCDAVLRGFFSFFDRRLHGLDANGRSCADCHMATDHFQLSPASAEARFRFLQLQRRWNPKADDPLFRPIDADDFRTNGHDLKKLLRTIMTSAACTRSRTLRNTSKTASTRFTGRKLETWVTTASTRTCALSRARSAG